MPDAREVELLLRIADLEAMVESNPSSLVASIVKAKNAIVDVVMRLGSRACNKSVYCGMGECVYCSTKDYVDTIKGLEKRRPPNAPRT